MLSISLKSSSYTKLILKFYCSIEDYREPLNLNITNIPEDTENTTEMPSIETSTITKENCIQVYTMVHDKMRSSSADS